MRVTGGRGSIIPPQEMPNKKLSTLHITLHPVLSTDLTPKPVSLRAHFTEMTEMQYIILPAIVDREILLSAARAQLYLFN